MKKLQFCFSLLLCFLLFALPLAAAEEKPITITLNHLNYIPQNTPIIKDNVLYISGPDLADMTYGSFIDSADQITLTIQNNHIIYQKQKNIYLCDNCTFIPKHPIDLSQEQIPYFPITLLDRIHYSYQYTDHHLTLDPPIPYSTSTDQYKSHQNYMTDYYSYDQLLSPLLEKEAIDSLLSDSKKNDRYISFITTENKKECMKLMKSNLTPPTSICVYFRQLAFDASSYSLSSFRCSPLTYRIDDQTLTLKFDENTLTCNCFWAAYQPLLKDVSIDLNKSLDVMIMRTLYEYYRNANHIKDDLTISPITQITYGRSDSMTYTVYFDNDPSKQQYELILYKQTNGSTVNYYIDVLPAK